MTASHPVHRKGAVSRRVIKSRRFWRWFVRLNNTCIELGLEYKRGGN